MSTVTKVLNSKPTKLVFSNYSWTGKSPFEVCRILNCDQQDSNEFVIAEHILVWITNKDGHLLDYKNYSTTGQFIRPCSSHHNKEYASEVIKCLRPEGLSLFYNYFVMMPWLNKLGIRYQELENQDYDGFSSDEELTESALFLNVRKVKQRRVIGHSSTTLIPPAVLDLVPGEYIVEEPCLYCDDYSDSGSDDEEPRALSTVKIKITVDPENTYRPVIITGKCHPVDGRQEFYHHTVEHCVIDPLQSVEHDQFVSLYCTSYSCLSEHFRALKKQSSTDVKLLIFYSLE
ncbi:hypothetical protein ACHWQZ_G011587 [Mnemiopsis leidyi]